MDGLNQIQKRNKVKGGIKGNNQDEDGKRKREGQEVTHSYGNPITSPKEGEEGDLLFIVVPYCTRLGTVHMPYPWRGNSYSSSSIGERRGSCNGIIIIHNFPTGQYIYFVAPGIYVIIIKITYQFHYYRFVVRINTII